MKIKKYTHNAKKHPKWHIKKIAESIKAFGCKQPIVLDKDGVIIAGHGRYLAMTKVLDFKEIKKTSYSKKGESFIPYVCADDLTSNEVKAYRIADNKINAMTSFDDTLIKFDLKELDLKGFDITLTGFDNDCILDKSEGDDSIPKKPKKTNIQRGDIYILGNHKLMCGDSTNMEDVSVLMSERRADMVLIDPPYNVNYKGKNKEKLIIKNDNQDTKVFQEFLRKAFYNIEYFLKQGGCFYVWLSELERVNVQQSLNDVGLLVKQCLIWVKNTFVFGRQDYQWQHESCLYGWKKGMAHLWNSDRKQTTLLQFNRPLKNNVHPTMKPIDLLAYQIINSTKVNDIVMDLFLGSGSTLIASEKTGRICFGMELDPIYVEVIIKRWEEYTGAKAEKI